jgi:signal transduction histidine kinase/CheY-like chemotaxis protein/HPt (histidine-containing phosphotransfer) domain-containing protein
VSRKKSRKKSTTPHSGEMGFLRRRLSEVEKKAQLITEELDKARAYVQLMDGEVEKMLQERTRELTEANLRLQREMAVHENIERELITARDEATRADRAKSVLLANMSHEIRTPVNSIIGMTSLLLDSSLPEEQLSMLLDVRDASNALLTIVNDVLDFARIDADTIGLVPVPFSLHRLLESVVNLMRFQAEEKHLALRLNIDEGAFDVVRADMVRLRQILTNLIGNAVKFTEKGSVTMTLHACVAQAPEGRIIISVEDTGIGIPAGKLESIFEMFSQADSTKSRRYGGTGLGLTISRKLARKMGGDISVESIYRHGSKFTLSIPCALDVMELPAEPKELEERAAPPRLRILLAEDNVINRRFATIGLTGRGHEVVAVSNGKELLERFAEGAFDIILTDISMPEMDGLEVLSAVRASEGGEDVPVIGVTGHALHGDMERFLAAGFDDCVAKPIDLSKLEQVLARALRRAHACAESKTKPEPADSCPEAVDLDSLFDLKSIRINFSGIEEVYAELTQIYREELSPRLDRIRDALACGDDVRASAAAHELKGASLNLGIVWVAELCRDLEQSLARDDRRQGGRFFGRIEAIADTVLSGLDQVTASLRDKASSGSALESGQA